MASRIPPLQSIPVQDKDLDQVQRALHTTLQSVIKSPVLDSQVLAATLNATTTAQTVTLPHSLGRTPIALHVVACSALYSAVGQQSFNLKTVTLTIQLTTAVHASLSVLVF